VPELLEADVAQADTGDETIVAGPDHGGQLIIEARVGPAGAGQTEVDRGQLIDPQAAEIVFDALAQLASIVVGDGGAGIAEDTYLADDRQLTRIGVERFADQVVDHVRAVVLGRVDMVDSGGDRGADHAESRCPVRRRVDGPWTGQVHGAVPGPSDPSRAERER
jgi:hypothetical protein